MPRKQFVADLALAKEQTLPEGIGHLCAGEDDGQIVFTYTDGSRLATTITAMIPDVLEYPSNHMYLLYCADNATKNTADRVQKMTNLERLSISKLLDQVAHDLKTTSHDDEDVNMSDDDFDDEEMIDDASDEEFLNSVTAARDRDFKPMPVIKSNKPPAWRNRVRQDLQQVKDAGFRVSILGSILAGSSCYVNVTIRAAKLGLSEETMAAWQAQPADYLVLTIHYPEGYKTEQELLASWPTPNKPRCTFRVSYSDSSKPLAQDVVAAFQVHEKISRSNDETVSSLRETFISKSLHGLLQDHLVPILISRKSWMNWDGAELFWRHRREADNAQTQLDELHAQYTSHELHKSALRAILRADHFEAVPKDQRSFPLLATQFMLRHFVRCAEFCLVCHSKISYQLEAIKPYVCDRPLCLFQYMTLGFGPSIKHEIQSQPYVVDLLISFCCDAARARKLKEMPIGLAMMVPDPAALIKRPAAYVGYAATAQAQTPGPKLLAAKFDADYDSARGELRFPTTRKTCPISNGNWIVIRIKNADKSKERELHCKVVETAFFPLVSLEKPVDVSAALLITNVLTPIKKTAPSTSAATPRWESITFVRYDQDFDTLDRDAQCAVICRLLDVLPSVAAMQSYLKSSNSSDLQKWTQRIPTAALSLLRWIIASNRACIMQVDALHDDWTDVKPQFHQERITGMDGYLQFRFAMGAPDKEQRFLTAVQKTTDRLRLKYPTIFAWHGSPLHNWHMIIREGLNFDRVDHGRAYGDGVYHAKDASTSLGYANAVRSGYDGGLGWQNSILNISSALALNELVNAPGEYRSSNPFYVVQHLDWIQTRYLFVKATAVTTESNNNINEAHIQDPERTPSGVSHVKIAIPASAIQSGRRVKHVRKKQKGTAGGSIAVEIIDSYISDDTDEEQLTLLRIEEDQDIIAPDEAISKEDFVPGALEWRSLPLLPTPVYATSVTTKRIMMEIQSMRKLMSAPSNELGWHIDFDKIENVYQWIVELHSFHTFEVKGKRLPLADEMKGRDIKSVVLEMRFGKDFPFSPPYVRVVRPRFKTFAEGGGGHIVMGGAMCMELLTNTGWSSVNTIESVLLQVRMAIASEPFARLDNRIKGDYSAGEAAEGYIRACRTHGWTVPPGFRELVYGTAGSTHRVVGLL